MYKKTDYTNMDPMEVYKLVAKGRLKKFPNNYLCKDNIRTILRHLVLNVYKMDRNTVCKKLTHSFLQSIYLGGAKKFFNMSEYNMINYCFSEWDIKPWEYGKKSPLNFWKTEKNRREFIEWVAIQEGLDLAKKSDVKKISAVMVNKYGGSKVLLAANGLYNLVITALPVKYKEWEIMKVNSWNTEKVRCAVKWLIEEKLKLNEQQVCNIKVSDFRRYNLDGMLQKACNHSILKALNIAYPNKYVRISNKKIVVK